MNGVGFVLPFIYPEVMHACSPARGQAATTNRCQWLLAPALLRVASRLTVNYNHGVWGHARTPRRAHIILIWNLTLGMQAWRDLYDLNKNNFVAFCSSLFMERKCTYVNISRYLHTYASRYKTTSTWLKSLQSINDCLSNRWDLK